MTQVVPESIVTGKCVCNSVQNVSSAFHAAFGSGHATSPGGNSTSSFEHTVPNAESRFYFVGIDKARFRKPVVPGDQLLLSAQLQRSFKGIWRFSTVARVGEDEVAHAEMMVAPEVSR